MSFPRGRLKQRTPLALAGLIVALPLLLATNWSDWQDEHKNYPARPSGYGEIVDTFGQPCSDRAHYVHRDWKAADNNRTYTIWFHRKLGGMKTAILNDQDGRSTNLDNDIWGHVNTKNKDNAVKHGIYGYACRYIAGTRKWSTHAWGIAIDVSSAFEHVGHYHSHVNYQMNEIWENHRWYWGKAFGDAMHFQYADHY